MHAQGIKRQIVDIEINQASKLRNNKKKSVWCAYMKIK